MNNDRELINAALLWHTAHARRLAVGAEKRRLEKLLRDEGLSCFSPAYRQQGEAARQLTELKRRELAALRLLAKACARQRGRLDVADVVDLDGTVRLLSCADYIDMA
ncbi:hypothetical protein ACFOLJ_08285 [Rugamonas sp. CCM 8940]|uniref:hypothetical protein n=1 Tax=Rugamonas sp. CCM 8940 TaxID=2765359 RepID=UPI0018F35FA0|nr:hypothetical protein [Rugamonas sp. CCM 8940]MBJ7309928.1 hypothetical protein [Rugamonas sp. CCM 8940]